MSRSKIISYIEKHEKLRSRGINLLASENYLSPQVCKALAGDLAGRYHTKWYGGSRYARKIIETTEALAKKLFKVKHAIVTPLSGNICDLAVLFAFTLPNEKVAITPFSAGGYPLGIEKFHRKRVLLPADERSLEIDVDNAKKLIIKEQVKLTILGCSYILFPQPVRKISKCIKDLGNTSYCVYDGSHVLGLIACSKFQNPIDEGAEVLFGSTHKSLYGPQGGIMLTNSSEHAQALKNFLDIDLERGIGLVDNPHVNRIAALGIALEEMIEDLGYGKRVIENARVLARALNELGVPVRFKDRNYTESHQILIDMDSKRAEELCHQLEQVGIFIDEGGRIGTAEITHRGMKTTEMSDIAELIAEVYFKGPRDELKSRVRKLMDSKSE